MQVQIPLKPISKQSFGRFYTTLRFERYDYTKSVFTNMNTKITIICKVHGEFQQSPKRHSKHDCPKCYDRRAIQAYTVEQFVTNANMLHDNKYDYTKAFYVNNRTPLTILCPIHGEFQQTPDSHIAKHGCIECGKLQTGFKRSQCKDVPMYLYYVKIKGYYKIGITKHRDLTKRFKKDNYLIIKLWKFEDGAEAYNLEKLCLKATHRYKYLGKPVLYNKGDSEMRTKDVQYLIEPILKKGQANAVV